MATVTLPFNKKSFIRIINGLEKPIKQFKQYFNALGVKVHQNTLLAFRNSGARGTHRKWRGYSKQTLKTEFGTWKLRYGTDHTPKRTRKQLMKYKTDNDLWFKSGPMKGYKSDRRYAKNSKMFQESGGFMRAFNIIKVSKRQMIYGLRGKWKKLGAKIMRKPTSKFHRPVLFITQQDKKLWGAQLEQFYQRRMVF